LTTCYYSIDGKNRLGPVSREYLLERYRSGEISRETLVWAEGLPEWMPIERFFPGEKAPGKASPPPSPPLPPVPGTGAHPWRRFLARTIDLNVCATVVSAPILTLAGVVAGVGDAVPAAGMENSVAAPLGLDLWLWTLLVFLIWSPVEAFCLARYGSTPGKWLFGITVTGADGKFLSFSAAWKRTLLVGLYGYGLFFFFLPLVTQFAAYLRLRREGTTRWDAGCRSRVRTAELSPVRATLGTVLLALLLLAVFLFTRANLKPGPEGAAALPRIEGRPSLILNR